MKRNQKLCIAHLIDCIYLGQLNSSFQKNGFGILQTFDFQTYIGYFRNSKAEGLGLVVLQNNLIVYAQFTRDEVDGLVIIDDGEILRCGIYRQGVMVGVGFQYDFGTKIWKMHRFHKGMSIQIIKQEQADITVSLPKIINIQQSLFFHLYNYLQGNYFPNENVKIVYQQTISTLTLGFQNGQNGLYGPGITLMDKEISEAGFYQGGVLHGYGFKKNSEEKHVEYGRYYKGKKTGMFYEQKDHKPYSAEYRKGQCINRLDKVINDTLSNQKKLNFNSKTFFSAKNTFPFTKLRNISTYNPLLQQLQKQTSNRRQNKNQSKSPKNTFKPKRTVDSGQLQFREKSCKQIMREKINIYMKGMTSSRNNQSKEKVSSKKIEDFRSEVVEDEFDDKIADEENPFY